MKDAGEQLRCLERQTIPAIIKEYTDGQMLGNALIENLQREDLNPIEEASAYRTLMEEFNLTQEELSNRIGKSRSVIANTLRLLNLPAEVQGMLEEGSITTGHGRTLASLENEGLQVKLARKIANEHLNVRDTEKIVKRLINGTDMIRKAAVEKEERDVLLLDIEDRLKQILGTKVKIVKGRNKGKIVIEYYSKDEFERIIETIFKDI